MVKSKSCSQCGLVKDSIYFYGEKKSRDGLQSRCKECCSKTHKSSYNLNKERWKPARVKWRNENAEYSRSMDLHRRYGITSDDFQDMIDAQEGGCAICGVKEKLCVDHCHTTDKVRGALCRNCNCALGLFRDDTTLLSEAIKYLLN